MALVTSDTRSTATSLALCAFALAYVAPHYPVLNNPNENVRFYMTAAIVEHGTYEVSALRERWGWTNDGAVYEGRHYSVKAPGTSLLAVPGYAAYYALTRILDTELDRDVALRVCRWTASILPMLVFWLFFHRWLLREGRAWPRDRAAPARQGVFFSVALGSLLYGYALLFVSHAVSAASAFGAFMLLYELRRGGRAGWGRTFAAGLLTALVTLFEYPGLLVSIVLAVYALFVVRPRARLVAFGLGALGPALAMMHFQWAAFGSPFRPGHVYVETDAFRALHHEGVYGATGFHADAAVGLLFDPGFGLLPLTPILAFAVIGFVRLLRQRGARLDAAIAIACVLVAIGMISFMNLWRGGWTIGPRYLAGTVPFLAWGAFHGLGWIAERRPRVATALALGTTVTAFVASGLPSAYYPHIPESFGNPLPELFAVLVAHGFAPVNAGRWLGLEGSMSMVPLALAAVLAAVTIVAHAPRASEPKRARFDRGMVLVAGAGLALTALGPLFFVGRAPTPPYADLALITRNWNPPGDDAAARLEAQLEAGDLSAADAREAHRRLVDLYLAEGRDREARAAQRRSDSIE